MTALAIALGVVGLAAVLAAHNVLRLAIAVRQRSEDIAALDKLVVAQEAKQGAAQ